VLIVRVGAMGDVLHALPAVAALRQARPEWGDDWVVDWVVDERWLPLLATSDGHGPVVERAISVAIKAWKRSPLALQTAKELLAFRKLRGEYDFVVDMQGTLRSAAIGRLAGGRSLAGYADPRESFAARMYGSKVQRQGRHVVEQGAALLGAACGVALQPVMPELPKEPWAEAWASELVGADKVCVLAAGAGWRAKQWPAEHFAELARRLRERGYRCLVIAVRQGEPLAEEVVAKSGGAAEVAVCDVAGLVALERRASLVVGGDTGPMHLAATLGVPVVALFGPTDPLRNGPWGTGKMAVVRDEASVTSYKRRDEVDAGLARVSVERVMEAVQQLI
jgi:heptosyltransferase-1